VAAMDTLCGTRHPSSSQVGAGGDGEDVNCTRLSVGRRRILKAGKPKSGGQQALASDTQDDSPLSQITCQRRDAQRCPASWR